LTGQAGHTRRQRGPAGSHLLELEAGRHLLGDQRGLDTVEQAFQPADQLCLCDPQLGFARCGPLVERQAEPFQLVAQLGRQPVLQLGDRAAVDLLEPVPTGVVERSRPDLFEQLLDHAADPHDLGGLLDELRRVLALAFGAGPAVDLHRAHRPAVGTHHEHGPRLLAGFVLLRVICHAP
jgi:hypothetical protein